MEFGAAHMKIVLPLFSHLTGEIGLIFSRLGEINSSGLLGGKFLKEANVQNGCHKLDEKLLSSVVYNHIRT